MRVAAILLALALAGCASPEDSPGPTPTPTPSVDPTPALSARAGNVTAPVLPVGRAWTYEGTEFYNPETAWTVVVARADERGYLLAGGAEAELVYDALWDSPFYGEVDASLQRDGGPRFLDLPLSDGKSWPMHEGMTLTARAAEVATPRGTLPGFVVEGRGEGEATFRGEYAPEIGNFVRIHQVWRSGTVGIDVRMTSVEEEARWVWYELGERAAAGSPQSPAQLEVPAGFDHVIASYGGTQGAQATVVAPDGRTNVHQFTGEESWHHWMLPAAQGRWTAEVASRPFVEGAPALPAEPPVGWAHVVVAPAKWVRSG